MSEGREGQVKQKRRKKEMVGRGEKLNDGERKVEEGRSEMVEERKRGTEGMEKTLNEGQRKEN